MAGLDLTAGGRLNVSPFVTERKALRMAEMLEGAKLGGYAGQRAATDLAETLSTSDSIFSFAAIANLRNLPLYDEAPNIWSLIATSDEAPDFRPLSFYNLRANFQNLEHGKDTGGNLVMPAVGELDTYQYAFGYVEESVQIATQKRGFKWGVSLERMKNDPSRAIRTVPADMLRVSQATDEFVVIRALTSGVTPATQQAAGTDIVTGQAVAANAAASPAAIRVALRQLGQRTDTEGNRIPLASSYYVVVPTGAGPDLEYLLSQAGNIVSIENGTVTYGAPSVNPLNRITGVLESEFIEDGHWYLVPAAGTTLRPSLVRVTLQGYSAPEVYVSNFNGTPIAGAASNDPFTAFSFDNDSVDLKARAFTNAGLLFEDGIAWSDGSGA